MSFVSVKGADLHALFSLLDKDDRGAVDIGEFTRNYQADQHQNNECVSCGSWLRIGYLVSCLPHFWVCLVVHGCLLYHHIMQCLKKPSHIFSLRRFIRAPCWTPWCGPSSRCGHESLGKFLTVVCWLSCPHSARWNMKVALNMEVQYRWISCKCFKFESPLMVPITHLRRF